jgi:hypothetical protein
VGGSSDDDAWSAATSRPGEIYTVEGRIRATGVFWRNAKRADPRLRPYRHAMWSTSLVFVALGIVAVAVGVVVELVL